MSTVRPKVKTLAEAVALIRDGDLVAIGGRATRHHPMALVREIIRQGRERLHLAGWSNSIDIDMLVGAGCVDTVETSSVGMDGLGAALNTRRAVESGSVRIIEHSEKTALDRFRAAAIGAPYVPIRPELAADLLARNPHLRLIKDIFTGAPWVAVEAIRPDVAIIHAHAADEEGNVQLDPEVRQDNSHDIMVAQSARTVIVSVEQIVSGEAVRSRPNHTILPGSDVTCVVEAPFGAHPCGCDSRYEQDQELLARYQAAAATAAEFEKWLETYVRPLADNNAYLEQIGMRRLMEISTNRLSRQ
jgi:glutaconate CoA-transferase subunit A